MFVPKEEKDLKSENSPPEIVDILDEDDEDEINWDEDNDAIPLGWKVGERKRDKRTVFQSPVGSVLVGRASALSVLISQNYSEDDIQKVTTYLLNHKRGKRSRNIIDLDLEDDARNPDSSVQGKTIVMNKRKSEHFPTMCKKAKTEISEDVNINQAETKESLEKEKNLGEYGNTDELTHEAEGPESDTLSELSWSSSESETVNKSSKSKKPRCDECLKEFSNRFSLKVHWRAIHAGVRYPCEYCEKEFSRFTSLQVHTKTIHYGETSTCGICFKKFSRKTTLQRHIQSKHKGIKYTCGCCDYQATTRSNLKKHFHSKHEGISFDNQVKDKENNVENMDDGEKTEEETSEFTTSLNIKVEEQTNSDKNKDTKEGELGFQQQLKLKKIEDLLIKENSLSNLFLENQKEAPKFSKRVPKVKSFPIDDISKTCTKKSEAPKSKDSQEKLKEVDDLLIEENGVWKCKECNRTFTLKHKLRSHAEVHVPGLSFLCNHCTEIFPTRKRLSDHKYRINKKRKIKA